MIAEGEKKMHQVSWSLSGDEMHLDQATSDLYDAGDVRVIDEVASDVRLLSKSLGREIKVVTMSPVRTHRSRIMSFAECFAALKSIVADRADKSMELRVSAWNHNHATDGAVGWTAWIGSDGKSYTAENPQALIDLVSAGKQIATRPEDVTL